MFRRMGVIFIAFSFLLLEQQKEELLQGQKAPFSKEGLGFLF